MENIGRTITEEPDSIPNKIKNPIRDDVRFSVLWIGHSSTLIQIEDKVFMFDPVFNDVIGAVTLGARVIEKHFTDDNLRVGPDHKFAMNPKTWAEMVERTRELELALGDGIKRVEDNEKDTVIVQRRCIRLKNDLKKGSIITQKDIECLRPAPKGTYLPSDLNKIIGTKLTKDKISGDAIFIGEVKE